MSKNKKIKVPKKLKNLGFKKIHQDKDGFFMFGFSPIFLKKQKSVIKKNREKENE